MKNGRYQYLPTLSSEEFVCLERDCIERGVMVPIEEDENGSILDGHNRLLIAEKHGLKFKRIRRTFKTEEEKQVHVLMLNMARRHLKPHQWGLAFQRLLELKGIPTGQGKVNQHTRASATVAEAAAELGVPERTARRRLELAGAYEALPAAEKEAVDSGEVSPASAARKLKQKTMREEAGKTAKLTGKYSALYGDPPWLYGASSVTGGADQHYATMATRDICAMPIREHVTRDAVLFLWATNPLLPDALQVIEAWGFAYKTNLVWVKDKATSGLAEYVRGKHELLLIATRGSMLPETKPVSMIEGARGKHSAKPEKVYGLIEAMYPGQRYLELFARGIRKGWVTWGKESKNGIQAK